MAAAAKNEELEALFEQLDNQTNAEQFKKATKTVDQILGMENLHPTALHVKGALLVKTDKHEELLKFLEKPSGKHVAGVLAFEKAYCLYRLSRFQEALDALEEVGEDRINAKLHLRAQLCHRLGRSKESITAYTDLFSKHSDTTLELCTNVLAAYAETNRADEIPQVMEAMKISAEKSFEIAFNQACGLIASGKAAEAEEHLLLAQRVGAETLYSEDFEEEEVEEEMAPVKAQLAFVAATLSRRPEAIEMLEEAVKASKNDPATRAVGETDLVALRVLESTTAGGKKVNMNDCLSRLEGLMAKPNAPSQLALKAELQTRLNSEQKQALHHNRAVIMLQAGRIDSAKELVKAIAEEWPGNESTSLLQAVLLSREGRTEEADQLLADMAQRDGADSSHSALLLRCQILSPSSPGAAADILESVEDREFSFSPAVIATKLALRRRAGETAKLQALLTAATEEWESRMDSNNGSGATRAEVLEHLLEAQAQLHMQAGDVREAVAVLTRLRSEFRPNDMALLVKLVKTTSSFDMEAAAKLGESLPELEGVESADVAGELAAIVTRGGRSKRKGDQQTKPKKKRKRKPLLPKGYDPANPPPPPDPERWLPKNQRSDFRKKKRGQHTRNQQPVVKGSQGAGKVDANLDRSSAAKSEAGPSSPAPSSAKKGKKGKK